MKNTPIKPKAIGTKFASKGKDPKPTKAGVKSQMIKQNKMINKKK